MYQSIISVLSDLRKLPYADKIIILGSVAPGDRRPSSNVDAFVEWQGTAAPWELIALAHKHYGSLDPFFSHSHKTAHSLTSKNCAKHADKRNCHSHK